VKLPSLDDPAQGHLTATVNHFSRFAIFGRTHRLFLPLLTR
jgi:hypothetical protein